MDYNKLPGFGKFIVILLAWIAIMLIGYMCFVLVGASWLPFEWHWFWRLCAGLYGFVFTMAVLEKS